MNIKKKLKKIDNLHFLLNNVLTIRFKELKKEKEKEKECL